MEDPVVRTDVELKQAQTVKTQMEAEKLRFEMSQPPEMPEPPMPEPVDPFAADQGQAATLKAYADAELAQANARKAQLDVENYVSPAEMAERKARLSKPAPKPGATKR
jgi:hypothetical protein